jgi:pimeloyl-ACP methyl ester carboxylesterase
MSEMDTPSDGLVVDEAGSGRPVLVLHGGGGPRTIAPICERLAGSAHVLAPTLPGWNGADRPEQLATAADYADVFLEHLRRADLTGVVVIGSSLGGWLTSEMASRDREGRIAGVIVIDGAGILVEGEPIVDFFSLTPRQVAEHSFHDPDRFYVDPATIPAEQGKVQQANMATMAAVFNGMYDAGLRARLSEVRIPALVIWGDSDRIFTPGYGRAYADSFADGRFELIRDAGHLPQLEQPGPTLALVEEFLTALPAAAPDSTVG